MANSSDNNVVALENNGTGSFTVEDKVIGQIGASALAAGDWDGDLDLDLAVANSTGGDNVTTLENASPLSPPGSPELTLVRPEANDNSVILGSAAYCGISR